MATWKKIITAEGGFSFGENLKTIAYGSNHTALNTAGEYFGETITIGTAATSSTAGKVMCCSGGTWALADKDTEAHGKSILGVVTAAATSSAHPAAGYLIYGLVRVSGLETSGSIGDVVYIGDDGDLVHTAPTGSGDIVRPVGYIVNVTNKIIYFNPDKTWVTLV